MSAPQHRPVRTTVALGRFCLSCAGTLACWCVWLVLGALLALQLYIAVAQQLPVPESVLRRFEDRLAEAGLAAGFSRAQFDPTGRLLLENVRVRTRQFEDPLLIARSLYLRKSLGSILSGGRAPDEIRLDGATLQLPAPLSPSGTPEPLLRDLAATVRLEGTQIRIDQLAFRIGSCAVTVRGELQLPVPRDSAGPDPSAALHQLLQAGRRLVRDLPRLEALSHPALNIELAARPGIGNVAELELTADELLQPLGQPVQTGALRATTTLRLDGTGARPLRVSLEIAEASHTGGRAVAGRLQGVLTTRVVPGLPALPDEADLLLAAGRLTAAGQAIDAPVLHLLWRRGADPGFALAATVHGRLLALEGTASPEHRTATLRLAGTIAPSLVEAVLPPRAPRLAPYFRFGDPVQVNAEAFFAAGWRFDRLEARVRGGRLDSNGVAVTSFRGRIDADHTGEFLAHDAAVTAGVNHARGSYGMNFRSRDYRMLLTGALHPPHIAGWFRSGWWVDFWQEHFAFTGPPPEADVDVAGNWGEAQRTTYFGHTLARQAEVLGADFEETSARVHLRSGFAHAFDLRAVRVGGAQRAQGWFKRRADGANALQSLEYGLAGNLDAGALRHLGGATATELLEPWLFRQPPWIEFRGNIDYRGGRPVPHLSFRGEATGGLSYLGFPLERAKVTGGVQDGIVRLDQIDLGLAGGRGTGRALLDGPAAARRLGFDFYLEEADLVRTIGVLHEFNRTRSTEPVAPTNPALLKRASGGRLQFTLSAEGNPADLASFRGAGDLEVAGAELGEIHLFGLLSQVLSGLSLNFSSLKLDTLRGSFRLAEGRATFPDLRVTGSTALIEGRGDYRLTDQTLDFSAKLRPYEAKRNLITGVIGMVINPLTSILELRLTGSLQDPQWSISFGSTSPRDAPAATAPGGEPPPTRPPAGS